MRSRKCPGGKIRRGEFLFSFFVFPFFYFSLTMVTTTIVDLFVAKFFLLHCVSHFYFSSFYVHVWKTKV